MLIDFRWLIARRTTANKSDSVDGASSERMRVLFNLEWVSLTTCQLDWALKTFVPEDVVFISFDFHCAAKNVTGASSQNRPGGYVDLDDVSIVL